MKQRAVAAGDTPPCPACRDSIHLNDPRLLLYKPVYLRHCQRHREAWAAMDERDRLREKTERKGKRK